MNKFLLGIQGYCSCFGWLLPATWKWLLQYLPELRFWEWHSNLDDHLWYAERINGRIAMLAMTYILIKFVTNGFELNSILF
jgi:hypothetical protein